MAWLQQQPTRERPDTFTQLSSSSRPKTCMGGADHTFRRMHVLKHLAVERQIGNDLLQLAVLILKLLSAAASPVGSSPSYFFFQLK